MGIQVVFGAVSSLFLGIGIYFLAPETNPVAIYLLAIGWYFFILALVVEKW